MFENGLGSSRPVAGRWWTRITLEHLWAGLPLLAIAVRGFQSPLPLLDFWWHLKMGEVIVQSGSIPRTDLFSFTAAGNPFLVQNWLAEAGYYIVYRFGGFPLLIFFNTVLLSVALGWIYWLCREATSHTRVAALAAFFASLAFFVNMRPQTFSFVWFSVFYWILDGYRFRRRDLLWCLPPLMAVWVNLHGGFVLGLGLIALYLAAESLRALGGPEGRDVLSLRQLRKLGFALVICAVTTLLNPETYRVYDYIRVVLVDPASQQFVAEWQAPRISAMEGIVVFYGLFFATALAFLYSKKRPDLTDLLLFLGFSLLAFTATRNAIWFTMISAPLLARYFARLDFKGQSQLSRRLSFIWAPEELAPPQKRLAESPPLLNLAIATTALLLVLIESPWVRPFTLHASLLESPTPVRAMDYIEQHGLQGNIFHPQIFGDYLIWRLYPRQRTFIDGRVHLFGERLTREYRLLLHDSRWQEKLEPFRIRYLLLSKDASQADCGNMIEQARRAGNWGLLFEDEVAVLFERKGGVAHEVGRPPRLPEAGRF